MTILSIAIFPNNVSRGNISIRGAEIDARFDNRIARDITIKEGGDINLYGNNINLRGVRLFSGYRENRGTPDSQTGDIILDATGDILLVGSLIENNIAKDALGGSGEIRVIADGNVYLDRSSITSQTRGTGPSRDITVIVNGDLTLDTSRIINTVTDDGTGDAGNIYLQAGLLTMLTDEEAGSTNQAWISTGTSGNGDAGNINIVVDRLDMFGPGQSGTSGITANFNAEDAIGDAGSIVITAAGHIFMTDRGKIESAVQRDAVGDGGNVEVNAQSLTLEETSFIELI